MNLHEIADIVIVSLPKCADRRWRVQNALNLLGLHQVRCVHPVPLSEINGEEYPHLPRKAHPYISQILTLKQIIGEARRRKSKALWLLEDDAIFHSKFHDRVRRLKVPNNWCFLYLGGAYYTLAARVSDALVRPKRVLDLQSVVISETMYDIIEEAFERALRDQTRTEVFADMVLADLHQQYPAYLCRPNLVWQDTHQSDLNGRTYCSYTPEGEQWQPPPSLPISIIYTFWSADRRRSAEWGDAEWLRESFARSAYLAQTCFSRVVLYTDTVGREMLKGVMFDEVNVTLDGLDFDPAFPCAAKFDTLRRQQGPFLHIEPDVFLKSEIFMPDPEIVFTQEFSEKRKTVSGSLLNDFRRLPSYLDELPNAGRDLRFGASRIIGGLDAEFFRRYACDGLDVLRRCENSTAFTCAAKGAPHDVSMALEQVLLHAHANHYRRQLRTIPVRMGDAVPAGEKREAIGASWRQISPREKHSSRFAAKLRASNRKDGLRIASSSPQVAYAQSGDGWFISLAGTKVYILEEDRPVDPAEVAHPIRLHFGSRCESLAGGIVIPNGKSRLEKLRLALLEACRRGLKDGGEPILLINGQAAFHPAMHQLLAMIRVPYDWELLYLGGRSTGTEEFVYRGLVKTDGVSGLSAVLLRPKALTKMLQVFRRPFNARESLDHRLLALHGSLPTYLCKPELVFLPVPVPRPSRPEAGQVMTDQKKRKAGIT